jgi:hypothetical protein
VWVISAVAIILYGQYKFNEGKRIGMAPPAPIEKLHTIDLYDKYSVAVREILVILFLVFSRDVQNAI